MEKDKNSLLIFDTNILYEDVKNKCDFSEFKFNKLFYNVVEEIEKRDLVEYITLAIPEVVWQELYYQRVESYNQKKTELDKLLNNFKFPNFEYDFRDIEYEIFLKLHIDSFKKKLESFHTEVLEIKLPSESRFESIISRAFSKNPPFEGRNKNSDKGFKDALIWESILEYKFNHKETDIILYSRDGLFNTFLAGEFQCHFKDTIELINKEDKVLRAINDLDRRVNTNSLFDDKEINYYEDIRKLMNFSVLEELIFATEVTQKIGSKLYDLSSIDNMKLINIIETTEDESLNNICFQAIVEADLTLSNIENEDDLELEKEEVVVSIMFKEKGNIFYVWMINILNNDYKFKPIGISGDKNV